MLTNIEKRFIQDYLELAGLKHMSSIIKVSRIHESTELTCSILIWRFDEEQDGLVLVKELDGLYVDSFRNLGSFNYYSLKELGIVDD